MKLRLALLAVVLATTRVSAQEAADPSAGVRAVLDLQDRRERSPEAWAPYLLGDDPVVRRHAALAIGRGRDPALAPLLRRVLEDRRRIEPPVLFALGLCPDPASVEPLLTLAASPFRPELRAAAVQALGRLGPGVPLAALLPALRDPDASVRGAGLLALARLRGRRVTPRTPIEPVTAQALLEALAALLQDDDAVVRWRAAYACFELEALDGPERARLPLLLSATKLADPGARLFATRALASAAGPPAERLDALTKLLDGDKDPHVGAAAAASIARVASACPDRLVPTAERLAAAAARRDRPADFHVRRAAIAALVDVSLGPDGAVRADVAAKALPAARAALDDPSPSTRIEAIVACARLAPAEAASLVETRAGAEHPLDRLAAARAAKHLEPEPGSAVLHALLADRDVRVVCEALGTLGALATDAPASIGGPIDAVNAAARQAVAHADLAIRTTGVSLLGEHGEPDLDAATVAGVASSSPGAANVELRVEVVNALAALGGREGGEEHALELLRGLLADEAAAVRIAASKALATLTGEAPAPPPPDATRSTVDVEVGVDLLLEGVPNPRAVLHTTKGEVTLELLREEAPRHVKSFLALAAKGSYDGLRFHRIVSGFVAQGLDPRGDGWGSGDVLLKDEVNQAPFVTGALGMPNSGPDTGGCQIFIMHVPAPHLDGTYTVFGRVVGGMDVVHALDLDDVCTKVTRVGS